MAYTNNNRSFNPDALPAHAEPEQAAQVLASLAANRKPLPQAPNPQPPFAQPSPPNRRVSPAAVAAQHAGLPRPQSFQQAYQNSPNSGAYSQNPSQYNTQASSIPGAYPSNQNQNPYSTSPPAVRPPRMHSPPPSADYGTGRRPSNPASLLPTLHSNQLPPRTPAPPSPDSADLYGLFRAANASHSGVLTTSEFSSTLVNADYTSFDPYTITTMMRMFSTSPDKDTLTYGEFQNLWRFLAAWRDLFERFDEDASGRVNLSEFSKALVAFGYRLSPPFVAVLYNAYNDRQMSADERRGSRTGHGMSFDLFVQACVSLKRMTDVFKGYDDDRDGYITLSFEEFLTEILKLRE